MASYEYSIEEDFPNNKVSTAQLQNEIMGVPLLSAVFSSVGTAGDVCSVNFSANLDAAGIGALDNVVANHQGFSIHIKFHESVSLLVSEKDLGSLNWEEIGGVVTDPSFFSLNFTKIFGRVSCMIKTSGIGAELRIMEVQGTSTAMTNPVIAIPDTLGQWQMFSFMSNSPPRAGGAYYVMEGKKGSAVSFQIKNALISLMETEIV